MTANRLFEEIDVIRTTGHLPLANDLSRLVDMASECVDHFDDGRVTLSFSIQVVLEGLLEQLDKPNLGETVAFRHLLGAMRDVASELVFPSDEREMLGKSDALIKCTRKWLETSN